MRKLTIAALALILLPTPALAKFCIGVVKNAPNCDIFEAECQLITLPNTNTFQVWVDYEPWTSAGIENLRDTRKYYYVRIDFEKDGGQRGLEFLGAWDMIGVGLTKRGLRVVESQISPPLIRVRPIRRVGGDQVSEDLPTGYNQAGLVGTAAFNIFDGANLNNRIDSARGQVEFPALCE